MKLYKKIILLFLFLVLIFSATITYSYYLGSKGIMIREYTISDSKIPTSFYGFKLLHFSDLHYQVNDYDKVKRLITKINSTKPDLVVFTGDLLNEKLSFKDKSTLVNQLKKIKTQIGKFYISGDNDIKNTESSDILEEAGFVSLDDNFETVYYNGTDYMLFTGLSTMENKTTSIQDKTKTTDNYLKDLGKSASPSYKILLAHEPDIVDKISIDDYDLILAGHNHNGQIKYLERFFLPKNGKKYYKSYQKVHKKPMYISNGIGNENIPFRLFNQPSINLYRFKKSDEK